MHEVGLPAQSHFIRQEVEYLEHLFTPAGLKPTPSYSLLLLGFPVPCNIWEVDVHTAVFARHTKPLHELTQKGILFCWNEKCQVVFTLLEMDASGEGIGAVLLTAVISLAKKRYAIIEVEVLAVVWATSHFHSFPYRHSVTVYTDHTAVKAIRNIPNPSGKHACYWAIKGLWTG